MIAAEPLLAFFLASVLLALVPGPDNIFVLTQSALFGGRAGILVTLGLCTGLIVHTSAVALGVATLFQASATAFNGLKIIGGLYLLYLAWQAFTASSSRVESDKAKELSRGQLYRRGIIMNVTNPKVSLFFLAFLPQFTSPENGPVILQIFLLGALFILATLLVFGTIALLAGTLGEWLSRSPKAQIVLNRLAGSIFVGLAVKLATSSGTA